MTGELNKMILIFNLFIGDTPKVTLPLSHGPWEPRMPLFDGQIVGELILGMSRCGTLGHSRCGTLGQSHCGKLRHLLLQHIHFLLTLNKVTTSPAQPRPAR
jgi:hypothetical protein